MDTLALGTSIVGQVTQGVANYRAGQSAIAGGKAEATSANLAAEYNAQRSLAKDKFQIAKGRAVEGASGISTTTGTALDIALYSAMQAEMDANAIRYGGAVKAEEARYQGQIVGGAYKNRATTQFLNTGLTAATGLPAVGKNTTMAGWMDKYQPQPGKFARTPYTQMGPQYDPELLKGKFTISG